LTQFKTNIPLNITGPSYQDRSSPLSSQQTKNFYHQVVEEGKDQYVLHSFPGLPKIGTGAGADRGMRNFAGIGFRVSGTKLQSFDSAGNHKDIGDIPGVNRMIITDDGSNLILTGLDGQFQYDGSTITPITDTNIAGSTSCGFINSQVIYGNPTTNLFVLANPNDPNTANGLNAATPESNPDKLVRPYPFKQNVYMFGTDSTEPYWNSGQGNPPLDRIDGQIFEVGLDAIHSAANTDQFLYWLGNDKAVYQAVGGQRQRISTTAISHAIESYTVTSDAIGYTFTFEGMNFYLISFPFANKTWVLNESLGKNGWFEVSFGTSDGMYQGTSLINVYGKNFIADQTNGNLYELDINTFTNNGNLIQRRRITSSINGKLLGAVGAEVQLSRLELIMEQGVGLVDGQGVDPRIQFEISFDGGRSWLPRGWGRIGRAGEHTLKVEVFITNVFHDAIIRVTTTDPVPYEIYSAVVDLRLTGGK
jgi:hypothetical protein